MTLLLTSSASAARLLQVLIERNGDPFIRTYYSDGGQADAATVWRYLENPSTMVDDDITAISADAEDPLLTTLTGDIRIRIQHVDRVIAQARVSKLMLRRLDPDEQTWFLPAEEVERTAKVAGLGPASTPVSKMIGPFELTTIVWAIVIVILMLMAFVFLLRQVPKSQD